MTCLVVTAFASLVNKIQFFFVLFWHYVVSGVESTTLVICLTNRETWVRKSAVHIVNVKISLIGLQRPFNLGTVFSQARQLAKLALWCIETCAFWLLQDYGYFMTILPMNESSFSSYTNSPGEGETSRNVFVYFRPLFYRI